MWLALSLNQREAVEVKVELWQTKWHLEEEAHGEWSKQLYFSFLRRNMAKMNFISGFKWFLEVFSSTGICFFLCNFQRNLCWILIYLLDHVLFQCSDLSVGSTVTPHCLNWQWSLKQYCLDGILAKESSPKKMILPAESDFQK